jgi:peptidoglycan/LPS O-acetylase OafA/YrhL
MTGGLSLYLDLLRLLAAVEVFVFHLTGFSFIGGQRNAWSSFGHEAVVVFFVLSGFVITHAAKTKDNDLPSYAVSRLTRVYSVALPCLALTCVFDLIGHHLAPDFYAGLTPSGSPLLRLMAGSAMLNEAWVSVQMLSNTPYWSISYEFWYYVLFATLFYLKGRTRWFFAMLAALVAGPKIMLLFPIWLMGWCAYSEVLSKRLQSWCAILLFVQPVFVLTAYGNFHWFKLGGEALEHVLGYPLWRNGMAWSRYVLSDTVLGASIALHLVGAKMLGPRLLPILKPLAKPIRFGADRSFTLYLLHQPAILMAAACLSGAQLGGSRPYLVGLAAVAIVGAVSLITERQRHRLKPLIGAAVDAATNVGRRMSLLPAR